MPKFLLKFNMAVIKEIPIPDDVLEITIGRKEDNNIVIDHPAISSHHARLIRQGSSYIIEDLNSTNGTFIGGRKILKAELHHNDQVDIAKHSLIFINEKEQQAQQVPVFTIPKVEISKIGCIRIVEGIVDEMQEIELTDITTYIGTKETAKIKIKPSGGLFGKSSLGSVALINRRPEGMYIIKAIEENYPKVNGVALKDIVELKEGDVIEAGKTKMVFFIKEKQ